MTKHNGSGLKRLFLGSVAIAGVAGFAAAYRFALKYRDKVGLPHRHPVEGTPADFGLAFENVDIPAIGYHLAGWFVPAGDSGKPAPKKPAEPRPGIVIVHGWESNRGRTFAHVRYLHAAGFHCLVFDVRGHGDSPAETLPINVPEFAEDTTAAVRYLAGRPEVTKVGVIGHSMGGSGAIVAASREPLIEAVVSVSAPADLARMTRVTFDIAELNIPEPIATPLAYFTAALLIAPRRHGLDDASAMTAASKFRGPLFLIHGAQDHGVPVAHLELIASAAVEHRLRDSDLGVETLVLPGFGHRWLYEDAGCRRKTATFFAHWLGGALSPEEAGERAAAMVVERPANPIHGFGDAASKTPTDRAVAES